MKLKFITLILMHTELFGNGAYLRWLEKGRVELCNMLGLDFVKMKNEDILMPVTNMNIRYKASAHLNDNIIVETWIEKCSGVSVTFRQAIKLNAVSTQDREAKTNLIEAVFDIVTVNNDGKLYRKMPEDIAEKLNKGIYLH